MRHTAFDSYHPLLPVVYFAVALIFCMAAFQPVLIGITLAGAVGYSFYVRGTRVTLKSLSWQIPLLLIIALVNPFFSASGSTVLFRVGLRAIYLESIYYGLCMGAMLVAMMLWFACAFSVLSTDKIMAVLGNRMPVVSLMISMTLRLVPRFVERKDAVQMAQACCVTGEPAGFRERVAGHARLTSVLMGWSMEDSLETADAMRARGWGASEHRSVYALYRIHRRDRIAGIALTLLTILCTWCAIAICSSYSFYPTMTPLAWQWGYIPYALLMFLPSLMQLEEWFSWRR